MADIQETKKESQEKLTEAKDVVELVKMLESERIDVWLDGGWGVDALLGEQTRTHKDVDIVVQEKDVAKMRDVLAKKGYKDVERDDVRSWNFVLGDGQGREIDVHVINFDADRNGIYCPAEKGIMYPAESLTGTGTIDGYPVKCISVKYQIVSHSGYELKEKDYKDVAALREKF